MPGVVAGLLLVFIPLTGDYITATVLGGAKGNMVGALVASQFNTAQNWALGSAMAVILIIMILGTVAMLRPHRTRDPRADPAVPARSSSFRSRHEQCHGRVRPRRDR